MLLCFRKQSSATLYSYVLCVHFIKNDMRIHQHVCVCVVCVCVCVCVCVGMTRRFLTCRMSVCACVSLSISLSLSLCVCVFVCVPREGAPLFDKEKLDLFRDLRHAFSKVFSIVPMYCICIEALTFQNCSSFYRKRTHSIGREHIL